MYNHLPNKLRAFKFWVIRAEVSGLHLDLYTKEGWVCVYFYSLLYPQHRP